MNPLETIFPGLAGTGYAVTSPPAVEYNCIGWAAGEDDRWWWPDPAGVSYWPAGVEDLSVHRLRDHGKDRVHPP